MSNNKWLQKLLLLMMKQSFKRSNCECEFCDKIHSSVKEWKTFTPVTNLQKNMMDVIERIEKNLRNKNIK